jgi:hypothetical protein
MSDTHVQQEWWQAEDGQWYPPERHPHFRPTGIPPAAPSSPPEHGLVDPADLPPPPTPESLLEGPPPVWRKGDDGQWHPEPSPGGEPPDIGQPASAAASTRPQRRINPLLLWGYCLTVLACVVGLAVQSALSGSSTAGSACSLLTSTQKRALLDDPPAVKSESGLPGTSGGESVCTIVPSPLGSRSTVTSLFVVLRPAPDSFPTAVDRRVGTAVSVGGLTAWWIPTPEAHVPGAAVPASAYSLVTTKDGDLVSVEVTATQDPEHRAVEAMQDALAAV